MTHGEKQRKRKEKREERKERRRKERKKKSKMQKIQETEEVEVSEPNKEITTEVPPINVLEDEIVEESEDSTSLRTIRRKGKMVISDSESTDTAGYAKPHASIPLLTMLGKNVVADQVASNEAFEFVQQDPNSDWILDEEEEREEGKSVSHSPKQPVNPTLLAALF